MPILYDSEFTWLSMMPTSNVNSAIHHVLNSETGQWSFTSLELLTRMMIVAVFSICYSKLNVKLLLSNQRSRYHTKFASKKYSSINIHYKVFVFVRYGSTFGSENWFNRTMISKTRKQNMSVEQFSFNTILRKVYFSF